MIRSSTDSTRAGSLRQSTTLVRPVNFVWGNALILLFHGDPPVSRRCTAAFVFLLFPSFVMAAEPIRLANTPALSPDGATLAFSWAGEIWTVASEGGMARPITRNPSHDLQPRFSPDGKEIAFVSDREGSMQVFVMPVDGSDSPKQITFHTGGSQLEGYFPDGQSVLVSGFRDHYWHMPVRFFKIVRDQRAAEELLFDDYGHNGSLSPDGKKLLFDREGTQWWRKGYRGSQSSQIWLYDLAAKTFTKLLDPDGGALFPLWKPDGKSFYYVAVNEGSFNLWVYEIESKTSKAVTSLKDDSVVYPCISKDGSAVVFRHLFDLYRLRPGKDDAPQKLTITRGGDGAPEKIDRRTLTSADQVAFSKDGLEIAFISGGDLWVMDTELLEPKQVTNTAEEERAPVFSPDGDSLLVVSDQGGQSDVVRVEKGDPTAFWWQNSTFKNERITNDADVESDLKWSPDGSKVAFVKGRGDLCVMDAKGKGAKAIVKSWDRPEFDWSPDGLWLVYAQDDNDFNRDVHIVPVDQSRPPFNISRHPDIDAEPVWSPDGKTIAFTGRRGDNQVDIYYVFVSKDDDEKETRDRKIEKAVDKITKARKKGAAKKADDDKKEEEATRSAKKPVKVAIDFEGIHERIHQVALRDVNETNLFWSPDGKKLAFSATIEGRTGLFTIEIPDELKPKPLGTLPLAQARWLEQGNLIVGLSAGSPASFPAGGGGPPAGASGSARATPASRGADPGPGQAAGGDGIYRVRARQEVDLPQKYRAAFELAWRQMRDGFYDEKLGNRNWDAIRRKYSDAAAQAPDPDGLATVVNLMLGELNGSHLGYFATSGRVTTRPVPGAGLAIPPTKWNVVTAHLGARFAAEYRGPGLKVKDVIAGSPADQKKSKIEPGEIILSIDGATVDPSMDLTRLLNGPIDRDIRLLVRDKTGKERNIAIRPIGQADISRLLYEQFIKNCRKTVDEASRGRLGYLHIRGMDFPSFHRFEQELYAVGSGKDGLIIDVRNNGGGSTTDHLLTALTQPVHAIAVPRGGGPGYPQDRKVYATWNKPIVVLCNQNSFSNAEIFSHAIKTLARGKLVGVPTAGGVISTGGTAIMDVGFLRMPSRGWHTINDGEDMELHGAVPDHIIWPQPGEMAAGKDFQLNKAVEVLTQEVAAYLAKPRPKLKKSSER
jgi:tricorn protease